MTGGVEDLRRVGEVCVVDLNPLANCVGCIFGCSEPKSIRPIPLFILLLPSSTSFCLQSLFKENPRAFQRTHQTPVCFSATYVCFCMFEGVSVHPAQQCWPFHLPIP